MKRPWQIWTLFAVCLAMVLSAMGWLTQKAIELDRAEAFAQAQANQEETIGSVLWQMDAELTRVLAPEIARPPFVYQPFYDVTEQNFRDGKGQGGKGSGRTRGGKGKPSVSWSEELPSPLLRQTSPFVLLHFELGEDNCWTSPQCPSGAWYQKALSNDASEADIKLSQDRLSQLSATVAYSELLASLPEQTLPESQTLGTVWASNTAMMASQQKQQVFNNAFSQIENMQANEPAFAPKPQQQIANAGGANQGGYSNLNSYNFSRQQRSQALRQSDLQNRNANAQAAALQAIENQRNPYFNSPVQFPRQSVREGISQPIWLNSQLLLARQIGIGKRKIIQGCWLDWPKIKLHLLERVSDILPGLDLEPVIDMSRARLSRVLATIPAQLISPAPIVEVQPLSPIRLSLIVAWFFLIVTILAIALLLRGVITLSERRGAFVSAVTHELRTPLTTFRMYAEMLSEGMVAAPDRRQTYLDTLRVEADRLSHLVENVLQYARLERGAPGKRRERLELSTLIDRVESRLSDRANQAEMKLVVEADEAVRQTALSTDPAAVEQILFNLIDNACKYAVSATDRRIHLSFRKAAKSIQLRVADHGPGIAPSEVKRLFRPFSKSAKDAANSAPGVGLGLALCRRLAADLDGRLAVEQDEQNGAVFSLTLPL